MSRPTVAITMGDASGIGPEIIMKALARPDIAALCRPVVVGDAVRLREAGRFVGTELTVRVVASPG
jgi:4-hydroxythreonine-4-phosphate dehydrogenase